MPLVTSTASNGVVTTYDVTVLSDPLNGINQSLMTLVSSVQPSSTTTLSAFNDGLTLGWYVAAAMVSVLSMILIRKALPLL